MPIWLLPAGLLTLGGLAGSQLKDAFDATFKEPGGGIPKPGGGLTFSDKANALFTLALIGAGLYIIIEGKKVLKG